MRNKINGRSKQAAPPPSGSAQLSDVLERPGRSLQARLDEEAWGISRECRARILSHLIAVSTDEELDPRVNVLAAEAIFHGAELDGANIDRVIKAHEQAILGQQEPERQEFDAAEVAAGIAGLLGALEPPASVPMREEQAKAQVNKPPRRVAMGEE